MKTTMLARVRPLSTDVAALIAVLFVFVGMFSVVFGGALYQRRQLESRFRDGPWTEGVIQEVSYIGSPKGQPEIRNYEAKIAFPNVIAGRTTTCVGTAFLGTHGEIKAGETLRIAPLEGTCGDVATAFN